MCRFWGEKGAVKVHQWHRRQVGVDTAPVPEFTTADFGQPLYFIKEELKRTERGVISSF